MIYNGVLWFCCLCNLIFGESSLQLIEVLQLQLRISLPRLMSLILDPGQILIKWVWFQQSGCGQTTCVCTPPFLNSSPHQKKKKPCMKPWLHYYGGHYSELLNIHLLGMWLVGHLPQATLRQHEMARNTIIGCDLGYVTVIAMTTARTVKSNKMATLMWTQ